MAVITFSRSYGSGGDVIAARVAELLGYRYFDKHLLAQLASEMGVAKDQFVDSSEENHVEGGFVDRLLTRLVTGRTQAWSQDTAGRLSDPEAVLDEEASQALVQAAVKAACALGNIVIVGRGGSVVLRDEPGVLHVFVDAPLPDRIRRVARMERVNDATARDVWIAARDQGAADYMRRFYGIVWSDPLLYHMVINAGRLDVEHAAQLVVAGLNCLPAVAA